MNVAIIDYGMGNLHSVAKALETAGADVTVTANPDGLRNADRIVLPGVGSFARGISHLKDLNFIEPLNEHVMARKKPFLGICLGMHLAAAKGEEGGDNPGLGWVDAAVKRFDFGPGGLKVPHMGWDDVTFNGKDEIFSGLPSPSTLYFVHSYRFVPTDKAVISAVCDYGGEFAAAVRVNNIHLVQFHPEKSQDRGLKILENFLSA